MLSKNVIKYIHSLELKKNRDKEGAFVAEGPKVVSDLMRTFKLRLLISTDSWSKENLYLHDAVHYRVTEEELKKASFLQHPQKVIAVYEIPKPKIDLDVCNHQLCLALDNVQDPGNLGTIIRIADWFGISTIFCNSGTADAYNPKVVQATMGGIARVNVIYSDLNKLLSSLPKSIPIYGTSLNGNNIYKENLSSSGIIIMGNEGNGISSDIMSMVNQPLFIPCYNHNRGIDSLNVAVATAVACAEFRRRYP